ncbi:MAG: DUF2914 domain-containing protein [Candidatus Krumholzibacteriia bacterium]
MDLPREFPPRCRAERRTERSLVTRRRLCVIALVLLAPLAGASAATADAAVATAGAAVAPDEAAVDTTAAPDGLAVAGIRFGTGIDPERREPAGVADTFAADVGRVYCWTLVEGARTPTQITHAWYHQGEPMAKVVLPVGAQRWRTYSSKAILPEWTGPWEVKVLDAQGAIIGSASFTVGAGGR